MLRLRANGGGFTPIHVTVNRVELEENTFAGLVSLRLPTEAELATAEFDDVDDPDDAAPAKNPRKRKLRKAKASQTLASDIDGPGACRGLRRVCAGEGERDPRVDGDNDVEPVHHAAGEHGAHGMGDRRRLCARRIGAGRQSGRGGQRGEIGRGLRPMAGDHR